MSIIITGSSRGIGAAIAREWIKRNELLNTYYGISTLNGNDVTNIGCIDGILFKDVKYKEPITALVNNAAIIKLGNIIELDFHQWKRQIDVNVNGVFNCSKSYVDYCIKNKTEGKIINIASTAGLGPRPGYAAYAASKAAIINFSFSLAEEVKEYGIKVYCVCPGAVNTDMRHYINPDDNFNDMLTADEVAKFICNLIINGEYLDNQVLMIKSDKKKQIENIDYINGDFNKIIIDQLKEEVKNELDVIDNEILYGNRKGENKKC